MEANTPKKIYINPNLENRTWLIGKGDVSFIEYTRTDAFIEKACKFLFENYHGEKLSLRMINDFKNYMKGE